MEITEDLFNQPTLRKLSKNMHSLSTKGKCIQKKKKFSKTFTRVETPLFQK